MIIAFTGKAGAGKSEAEKILRESSEGKPVCLVKLAAPLYSIQEYIYRMVAPVYTRPPEFVKDRKLLQWLGTDWGRAVIGENVWVDLFKARVKQVRERDADIIIVCDDCRFDNEGKTILDMGGVIVKINSNRNVDIGGITNHASEAGIDPKFVEYEVSNNGTLEEYHENLKHLFKQIKQDLNQQ